MSDTQNVVRIAFHGEDDFLLSSENVRLTDPELRDYLDAIIDGELPDTIRRISLFSRDRPFRRIVIDRAA